MQEVFESSILYGANPFFIETLTISDQVVTFKRQKGPFGLFSETTTILRRRIHRVTIETDILGSHFSIYFFGDTSFGNQVISGKHFKKSDVREIQRILIG